VNDLPRTPRKVGGKISFRITNHQNFSPRPKANKLTLIKGRLLMDGKIGAVEGWVD
jgi:hypothetical protein